MDPLAPFVCVEADANFSAWAPLTHQEKVNSRGVMVRLRIPSAQREGSAKWKSETIFLNDGATVYLGPHESFITAAARETPFTAVSRPRILQGGINAILLEVTRRKGMRLADILSAGRVPERP